MLHLKFTAEVTYVPSRPLGTTASSLAPMLTTVSTLSLEGERKDPNTGGCAGVRGEQQREGDTMGII